MVIELSQLSEIANVISIVSGSASIADNTYKNLKIKTIEYFSGKTIIGCDLIKVFKKSFHNTFDFKFNEMKYMIDKETVRCNNDDALLFASILLHEPYEFGKNIRNFALKIEELNDSMKAEEFWKKMQLLVDVFIFKISKEGGREVNNYLQNRELTLTRSKVEEILKLIKNDDYIKPPTQSQIKILSVTASPPDSDIFYEKEQQVMLDSLGDFAQADLFLDIPDMVNSTLYDMADYLKNGKHDILQITAHGTLDNAGKTFLLFEQLTEDNIVEQKYVSGEELAQELKKLKTEGVDLKLVILSSCHSAKANEKGVYLSIAETLHKSGIPYVIGMKHSISHEASINFNVGLFKALIDGRTISEAFSAGKTAIARWESNKKRQDKSEIDIPELFSSEAAISRNDFSQHRIEGESSASKKEYTTNNVQRGFIGRREQIREIISRVKKHDPMVILKGPGGIGKSTLTVRILSFCARDSYKIIEFQGPLTQAGLMEKLCQQVAKTYDSDIDKLNNELTPYKTTKEKLTYLHNRYMHETNWAIVFDNFEDNQNLQDDCKVQDEANGLLKIIEKLFNGKKSVLLLSTRYNVPEFENRIIEVPEYTDTDINKRMYFCNNLKQLNEKNLRAIYRTVGKNPRALDLLDALLPSESRFIQLSDIEKKKFNSIIKKLKAKLKTGSSEEFAPFILQELTDLLDDEQKNILKALSIYKSPVEAEGIKHLTGDFELELIEKLLDLSLVEHIMNNDKQFFYTHRLTADFFYDTMTKEEFKQLNLKAAEYCLEVLKIVQSVEKAMEIREHYLLAEEFDKAADIALIVENKMSTWGYVEFAKNLCLETLEMDISKEHIAEFSSRTGQIYNNLGELKKALCFYVNARKTYNELGNILGKASQFSNYAEVYYNTGQVDKALKYLNKAREIVKDNNNMHKEAMILTNIGLIYYEIDQYNLALDHYEKALMIFNNLNDLSGQATVKGNIGISYLEKGEFQKALNFFEDALTIHRKYNNQSEIARDYSNIGNIYYKTGFPEKALEFYEKALEVDIALGKKQGIACDFVNIGIIHLESKNWNKALLFFKKALNIDRSINNPKGMAIDYFNIGLIHFNLCEFDKALSSYKKSLDFNEQIKSLSGEAVANFNIGLTFTMLKKFDNALEHFLHALFFHHDKKIPEAKDTANNIIILLRKTGTELLREVTDKMGLDYEEVEQLLMSILNEDKQKILQQQLMQLIQVAHGVAKMPVMAKDRAEGLEQLQQIYAGIPDEMADIKQFSQFLLSYANGTPAIEIKHTITETMWQLFEHVIKIMEQESRE